MHDVRCAPGEEDPKEVRSSGREAQPEGVGRSRCDGRGADVLRGEATSQPSAVSPEGRDRRREGRVSGGRCSVRWRGAPTSSVPP